MKAHPLIYRATMLGFLIGLGLFTWRTRGHSIFRLEPIKPAPDFENLRYGPHDRNVLDLWKAKSKTGGTGQMPLVVYFHGGGFHQGDKSSIPAWVLSYCLDAGFSVASVNYRLSGTAPFPAPMLDGARAIQFVRFKANELGIDPGRIAVSGNSAGGGIALWVAFHDDLADPCSDDPVARRSSGVRCVGVVGAQTSYDPRFIKENIGGRAHEHPALRQFYGIKSDDDVESPRIQRLYEEASALSHVSCDDPPTFLFYFEPKAALPINAKPGQGIHHPRFGAALKARLDASGVECIVRHRVDYAMQDDPDRSSTRDMMAFFTRHFGAR